jgi:hypothetical protein
MHACVVFVCLLLDVIPQNRDLTEGRLNHAMIRHQNALAMFLASVLTRRIHAPEHPPF